MKFVKFYASFWLLIAAVFMVKGCESDDSDDFVDTCDYIQWTGNERCESGYPVYDGRCCPITHAYYNTHTGKCYITCAVAQESNPYGIIYKANTTGGGSSSSSSGSSSSSSSSSGSSSSSSSGGNAPGDVSFFTRSDKGCGNITVTVSGYGSRTISSYYASGINSCGLSGCANFSLPPGNYTFSASCSNYSWGPSSFTISSNGCLMYELY